MSSTVAMPGFNVPTIEAPMTWKAYMICSFAALGGILFGYDSGYINGVLAMNEFKQDFGQPSSAPEASNGFLYESWQKALIISILSAGTVLGSLCAGNCADKFGRKLTTQIGCLVYIAGVIMQTASQSVGLLTAGRAVAGLGVGLVSATVIMYLSEITPKKIRGIIIGAYQVRLYLFSYPSPAALSR